MTGSLRKDAKDRKARKNGDTGRASSANSPIAPQDVIYFSLPDD